MHTHISCLIIYQVASGPRRISDPTGVAGEPEVCLIRNKTTQKERKDTNDVSIPKTNKLTTKKHKQL